MTKVAVNAGLKFPDVIDAPFFLGNATLDAATEKHAHIGRLFIAGRPAGAKTLSTGTIQFRTGASTFADGATTLDIGIQDVATAAGPIAQPDGTFDVKTTLTGGAGITTTAWNTATMNSGSKSMTHGDMIAVVWDMTARGGADSVIVNTASHYIGSAMGTAGIPTTNSYLAGAWQTTLTAGASKYPNVIIVFDDGTLGWIDDAVAVSVATIESYQDSTNPDEHGLIFQVPWDCSIDQLWAHAYPTNASSDFTLKLYSSPTSTPSLLASVTVLVENTGAANVNAVDVAGLLTSEIALSKNTDYMVSVLATGTSNMSLRILTLGASAHRAQFPNGLTYKKATRNNSTGDFTAEAALVTIPVVGVRISSFDDGTGSGGGGIKLAGRGGLAG